MFGCSFRGDRYGGSTRESDIVNPAELAAGFQNLVLLEEIFGGEIGKTSVKMALYGQG